MAIGHRIATEKNLNLVARDRWDKKVIKPALGPPEIFSSEVPGPFLLNYLTPELVSNISKKSLHTTFLRSTQSDCVSGALEIVLDKITAFPLAGGPAKL